MLPSRILNTAKKACALLLVWPLRPCIATAAEPAQGSPDLPVGASELLGLGGSLILVIAAVVVVGWLYAKSQGIRGVASNVITVLASQALGAKERVVLIEVGGKQIVLGMTAQQVQTLHVFDTPVVTQTDRPNVNNAFADRLRSAIRGVAR
jgi:flagellar protein FliO/FliZ